MTAAWPPVAIVGVGNMGGGMARRLLAQGVEVHVCDIDADKTQALQALGAHVAAIPAQLGGVAHFLIVCVVTVAQVQEVLWGEQGLAAQLKPADMQAAAAWFAAQRPSLWAQKPNGSKH